MIQKYSAYVPIHHLYKGQVGAKGHCCAFKQNIMDVSLVLPRKPASIKFVQVIKKYICMKYHILNYTDCPMLNIISSLLHINDQPAAAIMLNNLSRVSFVVQKTTSASQKAIWQIITNHGGGEVAMDENSYIQI